MKPLLVGLCLYIGCDTAQPPVRFRDVTAQAGIDFIHIDGASGAYFLIETYGAGGGFFDSDGDDSRPGDDMTALPSGRGDR